MRTPTSPRSGWGLAVFGLCLFCLLLATGATAQTDAEINAGLRFDFTTPGARSLALGGAFVGVADDATAAFTNPAGLLEMTRPEVSVEARRFSYHHDFTDRGHAFGFVTGRGVDTVEGIRAGAAENTVDAPSFLSFVYPRERWAVAVYRHQLVAFEATFRTQGAFFDFLRAPGDRVTARLAPVAAALELEVANYGLSAAWRLSERFSLGLGLSSYDFRIDSLQQRFGTLGIDPDTGRRLPEEAAGALFGPADFSPANEVNFQQQRGSDQDLGLNLGFLWKVTDGLSLGGVYRQGPSFDFAVVNRAGAFTEALIGVPRGTVFARQTATFAVPDVWGLGLAVRVLPVARLSFDYDRVKYSALTARTVSIFREELTPTQQAALDALAVDDADELRLGLEVELVRDRYTLYLRAGGWYDPDHRIRFQGDPGIDADTRYQAVQFRQGEDLVHGALGVGLHRGNLKLDAALDLSHAVDTASISLVYLFGRE